MKASGASAPKPFAGEPLNGGNLNSKIYVTKMLELSGIYKEMADTTRF